MCAYVSASLIVRLEGSAPSFTDALYQIVGNVAAFLGRRGRRGRGARGAGPLLLAASRSGGSSSVSLEVPKISTSSSLTSAGVRSLCFLLLRDDASPARRLTRAFLAAFFSRAFFAAFLRSACFCLPLALISAAVFGRAGTRFRFGFVHRTSGVFVLYQYGRLPSAGVCRTHSSSSWVGGGDGPGFLMHVLAINQIPDVKKSTHSQIVYYKI